MKISITAKAVIDDRKGRLKQGDVVELNDQKALFYINRGEAIRYETKVIQERPIVAAGAPSFASPVAQALPEQTLSESDGGVKRRGRRRRSLSLTQPSE